MVIPTPNVYTTPVPPPAYQRAQAKVGSALHLDALTLVTRLHLLSLCSLAVRLAQRRCPPPLPAGLGGRPPVYSEESLLLTAEAGASLILTGVPLAVGQISLAALNWGVVGEFIRASWLWSVVFVLSRQQGSSRS